MLARDELANLAWGIEQLVEGPIGDPIDRDVFEPPSIRIVAVSPARDDDVTTEFVDFENPGDDEQDLSGLTVRRVKDGEETTVFSFDDVVLEPKNTLRLYTGNPESAPAGDGRRTYYCNRSTPIWTEADALCVTDEPGDAPRVVALKRLQRPSDAFADYRISTVIPDYWFPFRVDPTTTTDY